MVDEAQQLTLGHGGVSHHQDVDVTPDAALAAATSTAGKGTYGSSNDIGKDSCL